ncbi:MAG: HNH endonuclease [Verrucomicrobiae bacterium]|nr:HNH endonuclease [Verrucomicrobiae bacterium]
MSVGFQLGEIISYMEMCSTIGVNLQRGMNFRLRGTETVILMSQRAGAPYADRVEDDGRILIYEGHDCARTIDGPDPKHVDQPEHNPGGSLTQNGLFAESVLRFKAGEAPPERVRVYEKIRSGIWVYNGMFELTDSWTEASAGRKVFKFKLKFADDDDQIRPAIAAQSLEDDRLIPSWVKLEVWKRDQGKCQRCGKNSGLHFDHIIPYSKGGSSKDPANIQILCGQHNLAKRDNIE